VLAYRGATVVGNVTRICLSTRSSGATYVSRIVASLTAAWRITGDQKVIVKATQELNLESDKDVNIKAQGNIKIEGSGNINLEGKGQVGLKATASFKVEGATVDVKGQGPVSVSGAMVKLG